MNKSCTRMLGHISKPLIPVVWALVVQTSYAQTNIAPFADAFATPTTGTAPLTVTIDGSGDAGNIWLNINQLIINNFGNIISSTLGSGSGGSINIFSTDIEMNSGSIKSRSVGKGNAGSIAISTETATLNDISLISTLALYSGGGDIELTVRDQLHLFDSGISAYAKGKQPHHHGGNITIKHPGLFTLDNSELLANAKRGNGGNIDIHAEQLLPLGNNVIDASSELGLNGRLIINDIDISNNIIPLYLNYLAADQQLPPRCAERLGTDVSSFTVTGANIFPESPDALSVHIPSQLLDSH